VVVTGNAKAGIRALGPGLRVVNTRVGVPGGTGPASATPAPNMGGALSGAGALDGGITVEASAADCVIGAPGRGSAVVSSGNGGQGISISGTRVRVVNTLVGVAVDGVTPVPNTGL